MSKISKIKITKLLYICENLKNMLDIKTNHPLIKLNTFGIDVKGYYFCTLQSADDITELSSNPVFQNTTRLILGGGSNLLFTQDFEGLIIQSVIKGFEVSNESEKEVVIKVGSGIEWDEFVDYAVSNNYGGVENLSGIPGSVGASPIQNIGAYGCEVQNVIEKVEGYDFIQNKFKSFTRNECHFSYRNSVFKQQQKNNFLVSHVSFRLQKQPHQLITHYGNIEQELSKYQEKNIGILRKIILQIRSSKLPDHKLIGNAGSFFKNPVVSNNIAKQLKQNYPDLPIYPEGEMSKLSAAWLIDQSGLKGYKKGNAAVHDKQALVIVNTGNSSGMEILELAKYIQSVVENKFSIKLEPEVNII